MKYFIMYRKQSISILHRKSETLMNFRGTWPHAENQLGKGNVQQPTFTVLERKSTSFPKRLLQLQLLQQLKTQLCSFISFSFKMEINNDENLCICSILFPVHPISCTHVIPFILPTLWQVNDTWNVRVLASRKTKECRTEINEQQTRVLVESFERGAPDEPSTYSFPTKANSRSNSEKLETKCKEREG